MTAIVIRTARLALRELDLDDAPFILRLLNEEGFLRFIGDKGVRNLADARDYIMHGPMDSYRRNGYGMFLVSLRREGLRGDATSLGICGLVRRDTLQDPDVGFAFLAEHWGNGYASESAAAVLKWGAQEKGIERIVAITAPDNQACMAVLNKIGLRLERRIRLVRDGPTVNLLVPKDESQRS